MNESEIAESSVEDEEIKFDLLDISLEFQREPTVKVCHIYFSSYILHFAYLSVFFLFFSGKLVILT